MILNRVTHLLWVMIYSIPQYCNTLIILRGYHNYRIIVIEVGVMAVTNCDKPQHLIFFPSAFSHFLDLQKQLFLFFHLSKHVCLLGLISPEIFTEETKVIVCSIIQHILNSDHELLQVTHEGTGDTEISTLTDLVF